MAVNYKYFYPKKVAKLSDQNVGKNAELFAKAVSFHQLGNLPKAKQIYEQVIAAQPGHFDALHLLGVIAAQTHNPIHALDLISRAIKINPNSAEPHYNLGNVLRDLSRIEEAIVSYNKAISLNPYYINAYFNRGIALQDLGRFDEAVISYEDVIKINGNLAEVYNNRGNALKALNRIKEAIESFDKAVLLNPKYAEAYNNRGAAYKELGCLQEALADYETAISINSNYAEPFNNRGNVHQELKNFSEAANNFEKAIAINSGYADAWYNLGNTYKELANLEMAVNCYDHAITIKSNYAVAFWNKSLALLLAGQFKNGFELFEWRFKLDANYFISPKRNYVKPLWLGEEDISGKTLLIHTEQGLGDCIQFSRYAKLVSDLGAKVIFLVPKSLLCLLQELEGVDRVIEDGTELLPAFDYHCPLMSLPLAFKTEINTIPRPTPYLSLSNESQQAWRNLLGEKKKPRVGIVWSSVSSFKNDADRSMKLEQFIKCIPQDKFEIFCLQKVIKQEDQETLKNSSEIVFFGNKLNDFSDTAALASCMDLIVSTCTSVPHMTAALGIPTWILLHNVPDWRWLLKREDSPWYKSVKLYRQGENRKWDEVLTRVKDDLNKINS